MPEEALGLESGTVRIVPHDVRWPRLFEEAAAELRAAIGPHLLDVLHVGSTAVPGQAAKPILDILVTVPDFEASLLLVPALAGIGYEYRPHEEIPDRHYFRRRKGTIRTHHLSLAEARSGHCRVTVAFRDALRESSDLARQYEILKRELAARFPLDRDAYIDCKTTFVMEVLKERGLPRVGPAPADRR